MEADFYRSHRYKNYSVYFTVLSRKNPLKSRKKMEKFRSIFFIVKRVSLCYYMNV
jgi:hypothetical protein